MDAFNFMDFYTIFVNELIGDVTLLIIIALFLVSLVLIKNKAPTQVFIMTIFVVTMILSIEFLTLRWVIALFIGMTAGWLIYARLRRE